MRFAKPSSTRAALLVAAAALAAVAVGVYVSRGVTLVGAVGVTAAIAAAALFALYLVLAQRERHRQIADELAGQASFLERLIESMHAIAVRGGRDEVLERARVEAERLFGGSARLVRPGESAASFDGGHGILVPLRVRDEQLGALHLVRRARFSRADVARATLLADFAARESENARLLEEAKVREEERARLSQQIVTAEQDERRRVALFLHDGPVQSMAAISLMLDAIRDSVSPDAAPVMDRVLDQHRETIRALRDLSFHLEPVVLRDQGFAPAVKALAEQLGLEHEVQIDVDVEAAETLGEKAQAALYQIIRDALHASLRRGPPSRATISVTRGADGTLETAIADDAPGERRRATFDSLAERARTLNARFDVERGADGGTTVRVTMPPYATE